MNLFKVELRKNLKGSIIWGIILASILLLYMAFFPSMSDTGFSELLDSKLSMLPKGLLESLGLTDVPNFSVFMEYYSYVFQFIIIGLTVYAMILGTKALCMEEGQKTIEFLFSKPITRTKIVVSKMLASIVSIFIVLFMIVVISIFSDFIFGSGGNIIILILLNLIMTIPVLVYWAIGFAISSFLKDDNKSIVISLGLFFGSYLFGIIANTVEKLDLLKYLSPINYNNAANVFKFLDGRAGATLNTSGILISVFVFICGVFITFIKYNKKDLLI